MEKKVDFLEKVFCVLTIIFSIIGFGLLAINVFKSVLFSIFFVYIFLLLFMINQVIFIKGYKRIKNREYVNNKISYLQNVVSIIIFIGLIGTAVLNLDETWELFILGSLLMIYIMLYSMQNYCYTMYGKCNKKINLSLKLIISAVISLIILCSFITILIKGAGVVYV